MHAGSKGGHSKGTSSSSDLRSELNSTDMGGQ